MRNLNFHAYLLALSTVVPACGGKDEGTASGGSSSTADTGGDTDTSTGAATVTPGTSDGTSGASVSVSGTTDDPTSTTNPSGTTSVDPSTTNPQETSTTDPVETTTTVDPSEGTTLGTTTDIVESTSDTLAMTTGAGAVCDMLGPQQCMANPLCLAILGGKVNVDKMCAGKPMFLGCVEAMGCGDAITYACPPDADPPEPFMFKDTCIPEGWSQCESPEVMGPCK